MRTATCKSCSYARCDAGFRAPAHSAYAENSVSSGTAPDKIFKMLMPSPPSLFPLASVLSSQLRRQEKNTSVVRASALEMGV